MVVYLVKSRVQTSPNSRTTPAYVGHPGGQTNEPRAAAHTALCATYASCGKMVKLPRKCGKTKFAVISERNEIQNMDIQLSES